VQFGIIIIPESLKKYFWDVEFSELSFEKHSRFITKRILNYGNMGDIKWLLTVIKTDFIKKIIRTSRNLNAKTRNYWEVMLS